MEQHYSREVPIHTVEDTDTFREPPLQRAEAQLRYIREELDAADRTPFGDLGKLLDRMTVAADAALEATAVSRATHNHLAAALNDAEARLRGAGMLGGDDDPVHAALNHPTGKGSDDVLNAIARERDDWMDKHNIVRRALSTMRRVLVGNMTDAEIVEAYGMLGLDSIRGADSALDLPGAPTDAPQDP